ncbi:MAG TPA: SRPBCC family protein [Thermoanaerobaculia bacterium]|nr:SRPBCC family protein [Thermoanaerobaculia bacterium]
MLRVQASTLRVTKMEGFARATRTIDAVPSRVYSIIADYHFGHPAILPPKYFKKLEVLAGGTGAGTRVRGNVEVLGRRITFEHVVSEPEPGRTLVESDVTGSSTTHFIVDAIDSGLGTQITIQTQFRTEREGLLGRIERWSTAATLKRIYEQELAILANHCKTIPMPAQ